MGEMKPTVIQLLRAVRAQYESQLPSTLPEGVRKATIDVMMAFHKELLIHALDFMDIDASGDKAVFLETICDLMMSAAVSMLTQTSATTTEIEERIGWHQSTVKAVKRELPKEAAEVKERLGLSGDPPPSGTH